MQTNLTLDPSWTINETIEHFPDTITVFNAFGIDTCCGGDETIEAATASGEVGLDALMARLREFAGQAMDAR
jgi:regulator of cell morphogenesis and NO signaling